jgi:hypothetical protein
MHAHFFRGEAQSHIADPQAATPTRRLTLIRCLCLLADHHSRLLHNQEPIELHPTDAVHTDKLGPETNILLQFPSTASSGRKLMVSQTGG